MASDRSGEFQPGRVIALLNRHEVNYILIGGLAAAMHGSPTVTIDIDICYDREPANLARLESALAEVHARLRDAPEDLPFRLDARSLANGDSFTFETDDGPLDILGTPSGTQGYADLAANAEQVGAFDQTFQVAALEDLIRMKRAAGRPKDRVELEILGALREEIEKTR